MKIDDKGRKFILDNMGCIKEYFHRHHLEAKYEDYEDIQQTLLLGLCTRVDSYDETKGSPTTFIYNVLNTEWGHLYAYNHRTKRYADDPPLSLNMPCNHEENEDFIDIIEDTIEPIKYEAVITKVSVRQALQRYLEIYPIKNQNIKQRTVNVFILKYLGYSGEYIANKYGVSVQALSYYDKDLRDFLRKELTEWQ